MTMATKNVAVLLALLLGALVCHEATAFVAVGQCQRLAGETTASTRTTRLYDGGTGPSFKPLNRQQAKVEIDPQTGLYRPIRKKDKQPKSKNTALAELANQWDGLKSVVYDSVDAVKSVPEKVQSVTATAPLFFAKSSQQGATKDIQKKNDSVMEGYAKIEEQFRDKEKKKRNVGSTRKMGAVPGDRILQEYKATRRVDETEVDSKASDGSSSSSSSKKSSKSSTLFDTVKGALYESVDAASNLVMSKRDSSTTKQRQSITKTKSPFAALEESTTTLARFKPAVRARLAGSEEVLKALEGLENSTNNNNKNPIQKLAAGIKVRELAWKEEARQAALERQAAIDNFKEKIYQVSDVVQKTKQQIIQLPNQATLMAQTVVETTRQTLDNVAAVPSKIQRKADNVKQSIQESIQNTKTAIETVKAMPGRVKTTVNDITTTVQSTAKQTQETVQLVKEAANEVSTSTKVLLGLEKPVPKPPKSSPPETSSSLQKIGTKALQGTASVTGKVVWFLGKESVALLGKAGQLLVEIGSEALQQQQQNSNVKKLSQAAVSSDPKAATTTTTAPAKSNKKPTSPPPKKPMVAAAGTDNSSNSLKEQETTAAVADIISPLEAAVANQKFKMPSDEEIRKKDEEMKRLELEIEEALRMANEAIQSVQGEIDDNNNNKDEKKK